MEKREMVMLRSRFVLRIAPIRPFFDFSRALEDKQAHHSHPHELPTTAIDYRTGSLLLRVWQN